MLGIIHKEGKRPCRFPGAGGPVAGTACSGSCCSGCASGCSSSWHKGAGADACMQCTANHAISIRREVWKRGGTFSAWHPRSSRGEPRWSISFRVFGASYCQCWTGCRGAWSLDEGEWFGILFWPGPQLVAVCVDRHMEGDWVCLGSRSLNT